MRSIILFLALSILAPSALAQTVEPPEFDPPSLEDLPNPSVDSDPTETPGPAIQQDGQKESELDRLFQALQTAGNAEAASKISTDIQRLWLKSGSVTVDLLMARAGAALQSKDYALALDLLDTVVVLEPDFAEGWNRRATVYYLREEFGRSIVDIERVLALEPRHWGAMSGLGIIMRRLDRKDEALSIFKQVLAINPQNETATKAIEELEDETNGDPA